MRRGPAAGTGSGDRQRGVDGVFVYDEQSGEAGGNGRSWRDNRTSLSLPS